MNDDMFKQKYLKYKQKYLDLKEQEGGIIYTVIDKYLFFYNSKDVKDPKSTMFGITKKFSLPKNHTGLSLNPNTDNASLSLDVITDQLGENAVYFNFGAKDNKIHKNISNAAKTKAQAGNASLKSLTASQLALLTKEQKDKVRAEKELHKTIHEYILNNDNIKKITNIKKELSNRVTRCFSTFFFAGGVEFPVNLDQETKMNDESLKLYLNKIIELINEITGNVYDSVLFYDHGVAISQVYINYTKEN